MALQDDLLAYVPEDKRAEFSEKTKAYVVPTDDLVLDIVKKSQSLTDKVATPVVEARFKNFKDKDMEALLLEREDKIRKELAPKDETPEQKRLKALESELAERKTADLHTQKKDALRKKAAELGYDPLKAERLYALPDAEDVLTILATESKATAAKLADLENKLKYGGNPPPAGSSTVNKITEAEFNKMDPKARSAFFAKGGILE